MDWKPNEVTFEEQGGKGGRILRRFLSKACIKVINIGDKLKYYRIIRVLADKLPTGQIQTPRDSGLRCRLLSGHR